VVYWISLFANKLVVHESIFVERLVEDYGIEKRQIECIPHVSYTDISKSREVPAKLSSILVDIAIQAGIAGLSFFLADYLISKRK